MAQRVYEKSASLIITGTTIVLSIATTCAGINIASYGVSDMSSMACRFIYPFLHANILHAVINSWVFLSIVFVYLPSWKVLLAAYIIAVIVPTPFLSSTPTVGLSVVVYALFGYITPFVKRKRYFVTWIAIYIAIGFCFTNINAMIHLYGYVAGVIAGLLNKPIQWKKRYKR